MSLLICSWAALGVPLAKCRSGTGATSLPGRARRAQECREGNRQGLLVTPAGVTVGYGEPHRRFVRAEVYTEHLLRHHGTGRHMVPWSPSRLRSWCGREAARRAQRNRSSANPLARSALIIEGSAYLDCANGQQPNTSPKVLRPPGGAGAYSVWSFTLAAAQGYRLCYWGVDTRHWSGVSAARIVNKVIHGDNRTPPARAGDVILMHMSNTPGRRAPRPRTT